MSNLTPTQLIKKAIVQRINERNYDDFRQPVETAEQIEAAFDLAVENDLHWDWENEVRESGIETELSADAFWSRHYEVEIRALLIDNQYVAYPFYYAGGKHGQPESVDWMKDAFFVDCEEKQVTITQKTFTKKS